MAFNIPNQLPTGMASFNQGFKGMGDFFDQIKQHQLKQQQLAELAKYHNATIEQQKQQENRLQRLLGPQLQEYADKHAKNQPGYEAQKFLKNREILKQAMSQKFPGIVAGFNNQASANAPAMGNQQQMMNDPNTGILNGDRGVPNAMEGNMASQIPSMPGMQQQQQQMPPAAQQQPQNVEQPSMEADNPYGIDWNNPIDAQAAAMSGIKRPGETPAQKAAREVATKKAIEDYKLSQAAEKAKNTAEGTYQGEAYGKAVDTAVGLGDVEHNLEYIKTKIEEDPGAQNVIGPINQSLTKWFGSDKDKQLLGSVMSATGNIVLDAAKNIKGAFTGRDQTLINSMKPSAGDTYGVFIGKLNAMLELSKLAKERANIYADELHKGTPPHRAIDIARQKTDMAEAGRRGEKQIRMAQYKYDAQMGKNPVFKTKEDQIEFLNSLSDAEKIKLLSHMEAK